MPPATLPLLTLSAVLLMMAGEAVLSAHNAAVLRRQGAVEPPGDVHHLLRLAYPAAFVVMAIEGAVAGPAPPAVLAVGLVVFGLAKALKLWAIAALRGRWSFRVLVLPGVPLVASGPYRWVNHPNYVAVVGELCGVAATVWAPVTGAMAIVTMGTLIAARIRHEDRALGRTALQ